MHCRVSHAVNKYLIITSKNILCCLDFLFHFSWTVRETSALNRREEKSLRRHCTSDIIYHETSSRVHDWSIDRWNEIPHELHREVLDLVMVFAARKFLSMHVAPLSLIRIFYVLQFNGSPHCHHSPQTTSFRFVTREFFQHRLIHFQMSLAFESKSDLATLLRKTVTSFAFRWILMNRQTTV